MPSLPLTAPSPLEGELVARSVSDFVLALPAEVRQSVTAPVRDALAAAFIEIAREYQRRSRRAAALSDILRSTSYHLEGLARDHEVYKQPGEEDEALRARVLSIPSLVTPSAILAAVDAILAPHTSRGAKYFESELDQWFVDDGTSAWASFVYQTVLAASPHYADRLYPDDAVENEGDAIDAREVTGAWVFADTLGRHFVLRIPILESVDFEGAYAVDAADDGMFIANGTDFAGSESDGSVTSFLYTDQVLSDELYAAIGSAVELLKGQGMRWSAWVDPSLGK